MQINVPETSLVVVVGASGSGKSSFAKKHFAAFETLSSDFFRGLVSNDENSLPATDAAFEALHFVLRQRLKAGLLTVVDATNVRREDRAGLLRIAKDFHVLATAIVLDMPEALCQERNSTRPDRNFGPHVVRNHTRALRQSLRSLQREGFRHVFTLRSAAEADMATVTRSRLYNDLRHVHGPFDIVGDVHGCCLELRTLLQELGYILDGDAVHHPESRTALFLGDLVDRGPDTPGVLRLVMRMVKDGTALCIPGNHDVKLLRHLRGKNVQLTHGLAETVAQLAHEPKTFLEEVATFIDGLIGHYVLDSGRLVVAHAGLTEALQGRASGAVREFALYGETTGETDEFGLPVRYNWAGEYRGKALVVYGHTPTPKPEWVNGTICIDTGCVFGGRLTALRYPERELVSVPALQTYAEPVRPLGTSATNTQHDLDDVLDLADVMGKRIVDTPLAGRITIREENAAAALEVMGRFAVNPKWLLYLPPTMSPCETSSRPGLLEHPDQAFAYYQKHGVRRVMLQEKHMGSRAVVVVCKDQDSAQKRFGIQDEAGIIYTRTGRRFFGDTALEAGVLQVVRDAMTQSNFWEKHNTTWAALDCELMPWSAKAQSLLQQQYAPVGAAANASLNAAVHVLAQAAARQVEVQDLLAHHQNRLQSATQYREAYARYCWPVHGLQGYRLAPFHLLATEGGSHHTQSHTWHMDMLHEMCKGDTSKVLFTTQHRLVDLENSDEINQAVNWWQALVDAGGEGMVCKPLDFVARNAKGLLQPAIKVRGPEYLRIIYGPEYDLPTNLERLRKRGLSMKRSLAIREFALGLCALERFVAQAPLRHTHEAVFAVLALESEPVDPRL